VGDYCTISSGVVIGTKTGQNKNAVIGNNVEITLGVKIIGDVTIGDNVIIAPNSVVVKDIDANTIVSGVPAKFLKHK
jgi:serine O-acetyltransferase